VALDGNPLERLIDVTAPTSAGLVRVSLDDKGPLHFSQVIVLCPATRRFAARLTSLGQIGTIT
jgi:hypothetical protein